LPCPLRPGRRGQTLQTSRDGRPLPDASRPVAVSAEDLMRRALLLAAGALLLAIAGPGQSQNPALVAPTEARTPQDGRRALHVPPGFEVQLVAADPDIQKPLNIAFDARGRLWVTDTIEYPYPAADGSKARDTVKVLEDFGPDGRARKITTFATGLNIPI